MAIAAASRSFDEALSELSRSAGRGAGVGAIRPLVGRQPFQVRSQRAGAAGFRPVAVLHHVDHARRGVLAIVVHRIRQRLDAPAGDHQAIEQLQVLEPEAVDVGEAAGGLEGVAAEEGAGAPVTLRMRFQARAAPWEADGRFVGRAVGARVAVAVKRMLAAGTQSAPEKQAARTRRETASGNRTLSSSRNSSHSPSAAAAAALRAAPR